MTTLNMYFIKQANELCIIYKFSVAREYSISTGVGNFSTYWYVADYTF